MRKRKKVYMNNRKRNIPIQVYLSDKEYNSLCEKCERTGMTISKLIRLMLEGYVVPEKPSKELFESINKMYSMVSKIHQMRTSECYEAELDAMVEKMNSIINGIKKVYLLPRKFDIQDMM